MPARSLAPALLALVLFSSPAWPESGPMAPASAGLPVYGDDDESPDAFIGPPAPPSAGLASWVDERVLATPDLEFRRLAERVRDGSARKPELREFVQAWKLRYPFEEPVPQDWRRQAFARLQARAGKNAERPSSVRGTAWSSIGPTNVAGRVSALAFHPSNPDLAYVGAAGGGVWRWEYNSTFGTSTWTALSDFEPSLSIGAIGIDPSDPLKLYVGTGEMNFSADSYNGVGLLRSLDGGQSWLAPVSVNAATNFAEIVVRPDEPATVFAATGRGLYRSLDSGASWTEVLGGGAATGLVLDPDDPDIVYVALRASPSSIWKSTTGGDPGSFSQLTGAGACTLPSPANARVTLAIAPSSPGTLYAALDVNTNGEIWKSTDAGATWCKMTTPGSFCNGQCWYDICLAVDPGDPDHVLAGGINLYRSSDGGSTWSAAIGSIHVDQHAIRFAPGTALVALVGNDGGLYRLDNFGASVSVRNLETGFVSAQYYGMGYAPLDETRVYGGTQDNGSQRFTQPSTVTAGIQIPSCGDGGTVRVNPALDNRIYVTACPASNNLQLGTSDNRGTNTTRTVTGITASESAFWVTPIEVFDSKTIYTATSDFVYRCSNADTAILTDITWTKLGASELTPSPAGGAITTIATTAADPLTLWAGTSAGRVWISTDGGATWTERWNSTGGRARFIGKVSASATDADTAWISLGGIGGSFDTGGHIYETVNGGLSWSNMSGDLPDVPVESIIPDNDGPDAFWAGTWLGLFKTEDHGVSWQLQSAVPNVAVVDLALDPVNKSVYAATHGRGLWKLKEVLPPAPSPLLTKQLDPGPPAQSPTPAPGEAVRFLIRVRNAGAGSLDAATLDEVLDACFPPPFNCAGFPSSGSVVCTGPACAAMTCTPTASGFALGNVTLAPDDLAPGGPDELELRVTATADPGITTVTTCRNSASITLGPGPATAAVDITPRLPLLSATKTADPPSVLADTANASTFTITVLNTGTGDARNCVLTDNVDASACSGTPAARIALAPGSCQPSSAWASCSGGTATSLPFDLAAGNSTTFSLVVDTGPEAGVCTNHVAVSCDGAVSAVADGDLEITVVPRVPVLTVTKAASPPSAPVSTSGAATYTVRVENSGTGDATNCVLTDVVAAAACSGTPPARIALVSGSCTPAAAWASCSGPSATSLPFSLLAGETAIFTLAVDTGADPGDCANHVLVSCDGAVTAAADGDLEITPAAGCKLHFIDAPAAKADPWVYTTPCAPMNVLDGVTNPPHPSQPSGQDLASEPWSGPPGTLRLYQQECVCGETVLLAKNLASGLIVYAHQ